jgi:hypothetical protein
VRRSAQDDGFVRGLEIQMVGICRKHEQIEKVTGSQDDVFVGGLEIQMVGICRKHEQIEKVTGAQDDVFAASWRSKTPASSRVSIVC